MRKAPAKKIISFLLGAVLLVSGCADQREAEIRVPIYDSNSGTEYTTATAERRDFIKTASIGGEVSYAYADGLCLENQSNILEYNVKKNDRLKEGDVIAVFDSSALNYDYQNQKILTDNAYSRYAASGSEADRIAYEQEKLRLELVQSRIDSYTIKAPYDCIVSDVKSFETGSVVEAGTEICKVAKEEEIYVTVKDNVSSFSAGTSVKLKFGTKTEYSGKVVMTPESGGGKNSLNSRVLIKFDDGELPKILEEVGNIVSAGWVTVITVVYDKRNILSVPDSAVKQYSGSTYCYMVSGGERVRVPVEAGDSFDGYTIILSGLSEGDIVSC
ncbi:MAG: efflux RND transporter periplasmic adaptor subunit [Ruminiclostridium sp.]